MPVLPPISQDIKINARSLDEAAAKAKAFSELMDQKLNGLNKTLLTTSTKVAATAGKFALIGAAASSGAVALGGLTAAIAPIAGLSAALPALAVGFKLTSAVFTKFLTQSKEAKADLKALNDQISQAVNKQLLGSFSNLLKTVGSSQVGIASGMGKIAASLKQPIDTITSLLKTTKVQNQIGSIFAGAAEQAANYGKVAVSGIQGLLSIIQQGLPIATKLTGSLAQAVQNISELAQKASDSGQLTRFFNNGFAVAQQLAGTVKNLVLGFYTLGKASNATGFGKTILDSLQRGTAEFKSFTQQFAEGSSSAGSNLQKVFGNASALVSSLGPLIGTVAKAFLNLGASVKIAPVIDDLKKLVTVVGDTLPNAAPALISAFDKISSTILGLKGPIGQFLTNAGSVLDTLVTQVRNLAPKLIGPLNTLVASFVPFVSGIGKTINDVIPYITGPFEKAFFAVQSGITTTVDFIAGIAKVAADPISRIFSTVSNAGSTILSKVKAPLTDFASKVLPAIAAGFENVTPSVIALAKQAGEFVGSLGKPLADNISIAFALISPMATILKDVLAAATGLGDGFKTSAIQVVALISLIKGPLSDIIKRIGGTGTGSLSTFRLPIINTSGIVSSLGKVGAAATNLVSRGLNGITSALGGPVGVALLAAGIAFSIFTGKQQDAAKAAAAQREELDALKDTVNQVTGAFTGLTNKKLADAFNLDPSAVQGLKDVNSSVSDATSAIIKGGTAAQAFGQQLITAFEQSKGGAASAAQGFVQTESSLGKLGDSYFKLTGKAFDFDAAIAGGNKTIAAGALELTKTGIGYQDAVKYLTEYQQGIEDTSPAYAAFIQNLNDANQAATEQKAAFASSVEGALAAAKAIGTVSSTTSDKLLPTLTGLAGQTGGASKALLGLGLTSQQTAAVLASLGDTYDGTTDSITGATAAQKTAADTLTSVTQAALDGDKPAQDLADAFKTLGDNASSAASKADALKQALDILNGKQVDSLAATITYNDGLSSLKSDIEGLSKATPGWTKTLNAQKGVIDVNNAQQRSFYNSLQGTASAYSGVVEATYEAVKATKGDNAAKDAAVQKAYDLRKALTDQLHAQGLSATAAGAIADQLGLIPKNVDIAYSSKGTGAVQNQVAKILADMTKLKDPTTITVKKGDITDGTIKLLQGLGYTIKNQLNGTVKITSNVKQVSTDIATIRTVVDHDITGRMIVDSKTTTKEALAQLKVMGYSIKQLPNGKVIVTNNIKATTDDVKNIKQQLKNSINGRVTVDSNFTTQQALTNLAKIKGVTIAKDKNGTVTITDNTAATLSDVARLKAAVTANDKKGYVVIDSQTATHDALVNLGHLGYAVTNLPNKQILVTAPTASVVGSVQYIARQVSSLPSGKSINVGVLSQAAQDTLRHLGYQVNNLPDKTVTISVVTSGLADASFAIQQAARNRTSTITVVAGGSVGINGLNANGNLLRPGAQYFAEGGMATTNNSGDIYNRAIRNPMSSRIAQIIPPNMPRIIGDNLTKPELFLPIDPNNPRSQALLAEGAKAMGYSLTKLSKQINGAGKKMATGGVVSTGASSVADTGSPAGIGTQFVFNQYNPQTVPQDVMTNQALQFLAATGLVK